MSKSSDIGLIILIIGTFLIVFSLIFSLFRPPLIHFFSIQITGWIFLGIAFIFLIITKDEYHTLKLKNGFPLKLDHLIIFICAMLIVITFLIFIDINAYIYTGKSSLFSIYFLSFFFILSISTIILKQKNKKSN